MRKSKRKFGKSTKRSTKRSAKRSKTSLKKLAIGALAIGALGAGALGAGYYLYNPKYKIKPTNVLDIKPNIMQGIFGLGANGFGIIEEPEYVFKDGEKFSSFDFKNKFLCEFIDNVQNFVLFKNENEIANDVKNYFVNNRSSYFIKGPSSGNLQNVKMFDLNNNFRNISRLFGTFLIKKCIKQYNLKNIECQDKFIIVDYFDTSKRIFQSYVEDNNIFNIKTEFTQEDVILKITELMKHKDNIIKLIKLHAHRPKPKDTMLFEEIDKKIKSIYAEGCPRIVVSVITKRQNFIKEIKKVPDLNAKNMKRNYFICKQINGDFSSTNISINDKGDMVIFDTELLHATTNTDKICNI
jgi:hypothetical protein